MALPQNTIAIKETIKQVLLFEHQIYLNSEISINHIIQARNTITAVNNIIYNLTATLKTNEDNNSFQTLNLTNQLTSIQFDLQRHHNDIEKFFYEKSCAKESENTSSILPQITQQTNTI